MNSPIGKWLLPLGAAACATVTVLACSSADTSRASFDDGADSGGASLPDAAADDASAPSDAGLDAKGPFEPKDEAVVCTTSPCATQIVAGEGHFCARMSDGTVRCWGDDTKGSLGIVSALSGVSRLSAAGTTTCALVADGGVRCWGGNDRGQLGLQSDAGVADDDPHPAPEAVALPSAATRVDVGQRSACAVLATGKVWCWGDNAQRQLARPSVDGVGAPAEAQLGGLPIAWTAAGSNTGFGVTSTGEVVSWGAVAGGEGSVAARTASVSPDALPLSIKLGPVTSLSVSSTTLVQLGSGYPRPPKTGVAHACAVVTGEVYCWGVSLLGALGTGLPDPAPKPTRAVVQSERAWPQQVAAAGEITCVRLTDGSVQCAGDNTVGALGKDPKEPYAMSFRPADAFEGHAVQVAAAARSVCALVQGGRVVCWGSNEHDELGRGVADGEPHSTPLPIGF
jgi:alpha-tubulin suppressor-like RCC1 family protein